MFQPNLIGYLSSVVSRDVHGRYTYGLTRSCPFAQVDLENLAQKTSVRADSSASRGSADEIAQPKSLILVPAFVRPTPAIGDRFEFEDKVYRVIGINPQRDTSGVLDHTEVVLEVMP